MPDPIPPERLAEIEALAAVVGTDPCDAYQRLAGPKHSMYGQNDSGECGCLGCTADEDTQHTMSRRLDEHIQSCPTCAARLGFAAVPELVAEVRRLREAYAQADGARILNAAALRTAAAELEKLRAVAVAARLYIVAVKGGRPDMRGFREADLRSALRAAGIGGGA